MTNSAIDMNADERYPAVVVAEINVVEPNKDATLSFLGVSSGNLSPVFDSTILYYTVCVSPYVQEIVIKAIASDSNATISGKMSDMLTKDTTVFTITVTAEDGITTQDYIVVVVRCVGITEINNEQLTINSYEVFDVLGRKQKAESKMQKEYSFPFGEGWEGVLPNGIYIIKIQTNQGIIIKKVINQ